MNTWSIEDTQTHIEARFGPEQLARTAPTLNSLAKRLAFARYHHREIQRLFASFTQSHLTTNPLFLVIYGGNEEGRGEFEDLMTEVGAHVTACVLSIHSLFDILVYAVYYALGFNRENGALSEYEIKLNKVLPLLRKTSAHVAIADVLSKVSKNSSYIYVATLANMSKHQSIVRSSLNEDLTGLRVQRHEFLFLEFQSGKKVFPEKSFELVLNPAYDLMCRTVIDVGNLLNEVLKVE